MDELKEDRWKYTKLEDLEEYQLHRGLSLEMLEKVEVKELICGVSHRLREWILDMQKQD